jgi:hypothetical protein
MEDRAGTPGTSRLTSRAPRLRATATMLALAATMMTLLATPAFAAIGTTDLSGALTPTDLANTLAGAGVSVSNVTYVGADEAAGQFTGGNGIVGFDEGVILSSGKVADVVGPNNDGGKTTTFGNAGDTDLDSLSGFNTLDAAVLEFDFVPTTSHVQFSYVFSSEEYNEYVNTQYNDAFAFFVNGTNCAVVGDPPVPVTINTINNGNPFGTTPNSHPELYINNEDASIDTQMDGLTVVLSCLASVNANQTNQMKLAIADASDFVLDSAVFLKADSLVSIPPTTTTYTGAGSVQYSDAASLSGQLEEQGSGTPISGKMLDFTLGTQNASAGPTDGNGNASTSLVVTQTPGSVSSITTSFAGDAGYGTSSTTDPFEITKENCTLTYIGDTLVSAANMTNLKAQFGEPDASPGDWSNKLVTFTVTDASNVVQTFPATTDSTGLASVQAPLGPNVYGVSTSFAGDDSYLPCQTATETLVTVESAAAKITGGGFVAQTVGNTNFGFNVITDVTGLHGQLQIQSKAGKNRFHSTTVLTLSTSGNTGTWTGTGRWNGTDGYTFSISVVDNGSSGKKGDTISIVIKSPTNATVFTTGGPLPLKGGNITVH